MPIDMFAVGSGWFPQLGYVKLGDNVYHLALRLADAFLACPALVLAIAIAGALGPNLVSSMVSVAIVFAPLIVRLLRAGALEARRRDYVVSARLSGCSDPLIIFRHIRPTASPGRVVAPGLVIAVVVLCVCRLGDWVRDALAVGGHTATIEQEPIIA